MERENSKPPSDVLSGMGLATKWDGLIVGVMFALALHSGIIKIEIGFSQTIVVWLLLLIGVFIALYNAKKHKSLFSPPVDGFVMGFGILYSVLNLIQTTPIVKP